MEFEKFLSVHGDRVHYMIHRLGVSKDWYDEFYAEGIVALWQAFCDYDEVLGKGNVGTFLNYRIRFRLIDLLRKKLREAEADQEAAMKLMREELRGNRHRGTDRELVDAGGVVVSDGAFWDEVRSLLTEKQWLWVHYFIICDLSVKEIMEIEGVSADTVKNWGRGVRARLRDEEVRRRLLELV